MQAFQDWVELGLDFNKAHVQPTGEYHFHGASDGVMAGMDVDATADIVHVGVCYLSCTAGLWGPTSEKWT